MTAFPEECARLADELMAAGGLAAQEMLTIRRRVRGAYDPATQTHGPDTVVNYDLDRYIRSASRPEFVQTGSHLARFEPFFIEVSAADLAAAGWSGIAADPLDELLEVQIGSQVWPVASAERHCCESVIRINCRPDTGGTL